MEDEGRDGREGREGRKRGRDLRRVERKRRGHPGVRPQNFESRTALAAIGTTPNEKS